MERSYPKNVIEFLDGRIRFCEAAPNETLMVMGLWNFKVLREYADSKPGTTAHRLFVQNMKKELHKCMVALSEGNKAITGIPNYEHRMYGEQMIEALREIWHQVTGQHYVGWDPESVGDANKI